MAEFGKKASFQDVIALRETEAALLCEIDGAEYWIPKSQIDDDSEVYSGGHRGELVVSQWIADQKGIG